MSKFAEDWAKAKADFQTATKSKKPSATFLGLFEKGPGISAALKKADKAKTIGDLKAAMKEFRSTADDYTKTLDKAIADPKITPGADKSTYAAAVKKLKAELDYLYQSAENMKPAFESNSKKNTIDPAAMKERAEKDRKQAAADKKEKDLLEAAEKEAEKLVDTYEKLTADLKKALSSYRSKGVEASATNAVKQFNAAKDAKKKGETLQADGAAGAAMKFADETTKLLATLEKDWAKRHKESANLLTPGALNTKAPDHLPKDKAAKFQKDFIKHWRAAETCQREVRDYLAKLNSTCAAASAAAEYAEAFRITKNGPATYLKRIEEIQGRITTLEGPIAKRLQSQKAGSGVMQKIRDGKMNNQPTATKEQREKSWGTMAKTYEKTVASAAQGIAELKSLHQRLKAIPKEALQDKAVSAAAEAATEALEKLHKMAADSHAQDTQFYNDLENYIATGK